MLALVQDIFLSPLFTLGVLLIIFIMLSRWALGLREYAGYTLGWLLGIFFIVVYSALVGDVNPPPDSGADQPLTVIPVALASFLGFGAGIGTLLLTRAGYSSRVRQSLTIAALTTTAVIILFMMIVSTYTVQRLIGIFALAFSISAVTLLVVLPASSPQRAARSQDVTPDAEIHSLEGEPDEPRPDGPPSSRLEAIRERMRRRDELSGR